MNNTSNITIAASTKVTTKDGLLWRNGEVILLPEADRVAVAYGYQYAEQLVRALEAELKNEKDQQ